MADVLARVQAKIAEGGEAVVLIQGFEDPALHDRVVEQVVRFITARGYRELRQEGFSLSPVRMSLDDLGPRRAFSDIRGQFPVGASRRKGVKLTFLPPAPLSPDPEIERLFVAVEVGDETTKAAEEMAGRLGEWLRDGKWGVA